MDDLNKLNELTAGRPELARLVRESLEEIEACRDADDLESARVRLVGTSERSAQVSVAVGETEYVSPFVPVFVTVYS